MAQRQWQYNTIADSPVTLQAAAVDSRIVLEKVSCWSDATDGIFLWAGSTLGTILRVHLNEDATFELGNLYLAIPIGEALKVTITSNGGSGGCTTWWRVIKELHVSSPAA